MTKEDAIKILEDWVSGKTQDHLGEHKDMRLPIVDEVVSSKMVDNNLEQWTFSGLIKIAYDLEDKAK